MPRPWFYGDSLASGFPQPERDPAPGDRIQDRALPSWEDAVNQGFVRSRREYLQRLREFCLRTAEQEVATVLEREDERLIRMVLTLDEIAAATHLLTGRLIDWYGATDLSFFRKEHSEGDRFLLRSLPDLNDPAFRTCREEIDRLESLRKTLTREVARLAEETAPNCSAILGGLVTARLIARAGGLPRLARLPASSVQVLGAGNALFSHLRTGSPPPKHGIIYQHRRIHAAPRSIRGRTARVVAAKVAIAARLDFYREEPDPDFLHRAREAIDRVRGAP